MYISYIQTVHLHQYHSRRSDVEKDTNHCSAYGYNLHLVFPVCGQNDISPWKDNPAAQYYLAESPKTFHCKNSTALHIYQTPKKAVPLSGNQDIFR